MFNPPAIRCDNRICITCDLPLWTQTGRDSKTRPAARPDSKERPHQ
jgi:hypothetical protein